MTPKLITFAAILALSSFNAYAEPEQQQRGGRGGGQQGGQQAGGRGGRAGGQTQTTPQAPTGQQTGQQGGRGRGGQQPGQQPGQRQGGQQQGTTPTGQRGQGGRGRGGQQPGQQPGQPGGQQTGQTGQQGGRGRGGQTPGQQPGQQGGQRPGQGGGQGRGGQDHTPPTRIHNPNIPNRPQGQANPRGRQTGEQSFGNRARVQHFDGGGSKFEWTNGNHKGETRVMEPRGPNRSGRPGSFHATYADKNGHVTREVFAGRRIEYDDHGGRTVFEGNRRFVESRNGDRLIRTVHFDRPIFGRSPVDFRHSYDAFSCRFCRNEALWWFSWDANATWNVWNGWGANNWGYRFFARDYNAPWNAPWGYNYWNTYAWPESYGWWHYTTSYYWRPYGYRHHVYLPGYAPRYGVLDYVIAQNAQVAWETRLQAARDRVALDYEERLAEAEDSQQAALQAQRAIDTQNAVNQEIASAQADAQAQAAANQNSTPANSNDGATSVTDAESDQLANQVSGSVDDQANSTALPQSFENALSNNDWIYLVASAPSDTFHDDRSNTDCTLQGNDMLKKSPTWSTDLISGTGSVEVIVEKSQPGSCPSGSQLTMTVAQLQDIFNTFQESSSDAMSQLAPANNPTAAGQ